MCFYRFVLRSFFLLSLLCISINLRYSHACNTVVMSGFGAPSCYLELLDKLQNRYAGLLVLHCWPMAHRQNVASF